jgi:hypothetical protein
MRGRRRYTVRRPEVLGCKSRHLIKLARTGGSTYLGEIINCNKVCETCLRGDDEDNMLLCDKCNAGYHMKCLRPVIVIPPCDDWFCPLCSEDKLKAFDVHKKEFKKNQVREQVQPLLVKETGCIQGIHDSHMSLSFAEKESVCLQL